MQFGFFRLIFFPLQTFKVKIEAFRVEKSF